MIPSATSPLLLVIVLAIFERSMFLAAKMTCIPKNPMLDPNCQSACKNDVQDQFCAGLCDCTEAQSANDTCAPLDFAPRGFIKVPENVTAGTPLFDISVTGGETWQFRLERSETVDGTAWRELQTYLKLRRFADKYEMVLDRMLDLEDIYARYGVKLAALTLTLICTTGDTDLSRTSQLFVIINPVNEYAPEFKNLPLENNIPEDTKIGSYVFILRSRVLDRDVSTAATELGPFQAWKYLTDDRHDGRAYFSLNDTQLGSIVLVKSLDYEALAAVQATTFFLNVSASDTHGLTTFTTVTLRVTDVDDLPPEFYHPSCPVVIVRSKPCLVSYEARVPVGFKGELTNMSPGRIHARDMDSLASRIVYSIEGAPGEPDDTLEKFAIQPETGSVSLVTALTETRVLQLVIVAREESSVARSTQAALKVTVFDSTPIITDNSGSNGNSGNKGDNSGNSGWELGKLAGPNPGRGSGSSGGGVPLYLTLTLIFGLLFVLIHTILCVVCLKKSANQRARVLPFAQPSYCGSAGSFAIPHGPMAEPHVFSTHTPKGDNSIPIAGENQPIVTRSFTQETEVSMMPNGGVTHSRKDTHIESTTFPPDSTSPPVLMLIPGWGSAAGKRRAMAATGGVPDEAAPLPPTQQHPPAALHAAVPTQSRDNEDAVDSRPGKLPDRSSGYSSPPTSPSSGPGTSLSTVASPSRRIRSSPVLPEVGTAEASRRTVSTPDIRNIPPLSPALERRGSLDQQHNNNRQGWASGSQITRRDIGPRPITYRERSPNGRDGSSSASGHSSSNTSVSELSVRFAGDQHHGSQTLSQTHAPERSGDRQTLSILPLERASILSSDDAKVVIGNAALDSMHHTQPITGEAGRVRRSSVVIHAVEDTMGPTESLYPGTNTNYLIARPYTGPGHRQDQISADEELSETMCHRSLSGPALEKRRRKKRKKNKSGKPEESYLPRTAPDITMYDRHGETLDHKPESSSHHNSREGYDIYRPETYQFDLYPAESKFYARHEGYRVTSDARARHPSSSAHAQRRVRSQRSLVQPDRSRLQPYLLLHHQARDVTPAQQQMTQPEAQQHWSRQDDLVPQYRQQPPEPEVCKRYHVTRGLVNKQQQLPIAQPGHNIKPERFLSHQHVHPQNEQQQQQQQQRQRQQSQASRRQKRSHRAASERGIPVPRPDQYASQQPATAPQVGGYDLKGQLLDQNEGLGDEDVQNWVNSTH